MWIAGTVIPGGTNGERNADFAVDLSWNIVVSAGDFVWAVPPAPVVIESFGSTSLTQIGANCYLYSGGAGPQLSYGDAAVTVGEFGSGWNLPFNLDADFLLQPNVLW